MAIVHFALAAAYGLILLPAFHGWGLFLNTRLAPQSRADWSLRTAWGLAFVISVGGVLNLFSLINRWSTLALMGIGLVFSLRHLQTIFRSRQRHSPYSSETFRLSMVLLVIGAAAMAIYASTVAVPQRPGAVFPRNFNAHDDYQAYLVFPIRMLETGTMGPDVFNERRLVTGFGAQSFLHTLTLNLLPEKHLFIIDPGLGLLLVLGLAAGELRRRRAPPWWALIALGTLLLIPPPTANSSSLMIAAALFLAYGRTLCWKPLDETTRVRTILEAMILAGLCALKFSLLPAALAAFACVHIWRIRHADSYSRAVSTGFAAAGILMIFLAPWSLEMFRSTGSFLYPLLGEGGHIRHVPGSKSGLPGWSWFEMSGGLYTLLKEPLVMASLMLAGAGMILRTGAARRREPALALLAASLTGVLTIATALGRFDSYRFIFPMALAAMAYSLCTAMDRSEPNVSRGWRQGALMVTSLLAIVLVLLGVRAQLSDYSRGMIRSTRFGLEGGSITSPDERSRHARLQQTVPPGTRLLTRLSKPFLMDFSRNEILVADRPGQVGPPPGVPFQRGSEALAAYLLQQGVRFVAYDYLAEAGFPRDIFTRRLDPYGHAWVRGAAMRTLDFQSNLSELGQTRRRIYDDRKSFLLDLSQIVSATPAPADAGAEAANR